MRPFGPVDVFIFLQTLKKKDAAGACMISIFLIGAIVDRLM